MSINVAELLFKEKIRVLLYGNEKSDDVLNRRVLEEVAKFISKSKRLDVLVTGGRRVGGGGGRGGTHSHGLTYS